MARGPFKNCSMN